MDYNISRIQQEMDPASSEPFLQKPFLQKNSLEPSEVLKEALRSSLVCYLYSKNNP